MIMSIFSWIFLGLNCINIGLFIFSYIKKLNLFNKITAALFLPLIFANLLPFYIDFLPDSQNLLINSIIAISCYFVAELLFFDKKIFHDISQILFFIGTFAYSQLYSSTFYIYAIPQWIIITSTIVFLLIFVLILFLIKTTSIKSIVGIFLNYICLSIFIFSAFITLINDAKLYSLFLFIGTLFLLARYVIYKITTKRNVYLCKELTLPLLMTISQLFILIAGILMQAR